MMIIHNSGARREKERGWGEEGVSRNLMMIIHNCRARREKERGMG